MGTNTLELIDVSREAAVLPPRAAEAAGKGRAMPDSATAVRNGSKLLEKCALINALDEQGRRELISYAWPRHVGAGEPIWPLGAPGHNMVAPVVATVRISLPTTKGRKIILADLPAGELFGEIAMLDGRSRSD